MSTKLDADVIALIEITGQTIAELLLAHDAKNDAAYQTAFDIIDKNLLPQIESLTFQDVDDTTRGIIAVIIGGIRYVIADTQPSLSAQS